MSHKPRGGSRFAATAATAPAIEARQPVTAIAAEPPVQKPDVETTESIVPEIEASQFAVPATAEPPVQEPDVETIEDIVPAIEASAPEIAEPPTTIDTAPTTPLLKGIATMMKSPEDFVAFGQANLEAFVKSGQIWSTGMQELTKQFASTAKASFDESVSTFKALSTVKSMKEVIELQSAYAKTSLEKAMAESNKLTDASIKLTEEAIAPIAARVTVAVEGFGKAAA